MKYEREVVINGLCYNIVSAFYHYHVHNFNKTIQVIITKREIDIYEFLFSRRKKREKIK